MAILFHPLLLVTYVLIFWLFSNPFVFGYNHISHAGVLIIYSSVLTFIIPLIGLLLLKGTGLIQTITLKTKKERIGPLIIASIFYLWFFINCKNNSDIPYIFTLFVFSALIALLISFVVNVFIKTSLHAAGLSSLVIYLLIIFFEVKGLIDVHSILSYLILSILLMGFLLSGRLFQKAHTSEEIMIGCLIGIVAQLSSLYFLN